MNIKLKFTPKTHTTRTGLNWRWLDVKGVNWIAVEMENGDETVVNIDDDGTAKSMCSFSRFKEFDLLSIATLNPAPLPLNMNPAIKFARYRYESKLWEMSERKDFGFSSYLNPKLFTVPADPSVHELVDGEWRRIEDG